MDNVTLVKIERYPIVVFVDHGSISDWCIWAEKRTYSDGTTITVTKQV